MRVLGEYNRENPYADDLKEAYDSYVTFNIDKILVAVDMVREGAPDPCTELINWLEDNEPDSANPEYREMVAKEFTNHFRDLFSQYIRILNSFVKELIKEERTIKYTLEQQILYITGDEIKNSKDEDYSIDKDVDDLQRYCLQLMPQIYADLANQIKDDFKAYLSPDDELNISEPFDEYLFNQISEKVVFLNELGIIEFLKEKFPDLQQPTKLGAVVGIILGEYPETLRKAISDIDKRGKNSHPYKKANPYNSPETIKKVKSRLVRFIDEKHFKDI